MKTLIFLLFLAISLPSTLQAGSNFHKNIGEAQKVLDALKEKDRLRPLVPESAEDEGDREVPLLPRENEPELEGSGFVPLLKRIPDGTNDAADEEHNGLVGEYNRVVEDLNGLMKDNIPLFQKPEGCKPTDDSEDCQDEAPELDELKLLDAEFEN